MQKTINAAFDRIVETTAVRKLIRLLNKLWVRMVLIGVLSLLAIAVARISGPLIPVGLKDVVGANSVESLLQIIANSMLAVTTFSLSVVVTVFRSASGQWTPRAHRLMLEDQTMLNTLATLVGAYIYALTSIVLLNTQVFADDQVVVLFFFTIFVLVLIVFAIVRWFVHLQTLGSLIETTQKLEDNTIASLRKRVARPCLGANPLRDLRDIPDDAAPFHSVSTGYVQRIYEGALSEMCEKQGIKVYLVAPVGRFVHKGEVIAHASRLDDDIARTLTANIGVGTLRTFEQDPRFGIVVLGEIGSKALSPGINDPGTAIDVLGRIGRIFDHYVNESDCDTDAIAHPGLWFPPLDPADLIEDGFAPIARDGAGVIEVQLALQKALTHIARHEDDALAQAARDMARTAYVNAMRKIEFDNDKDRLRAAVPEYARSG